MIKKSAIENGEMFVIDNFPTESDKVEFWYAAQNSKYEYGQRSDSYDGRSQRRLSSHFNPDDFVRTNFWKQLEGIVEHPLGLVEAYVNISESHTLTFPHCDNKLNEMSVLLYLNNEWHRSWGGYTVFFDGMTGNKIKKTVVPEPGKVVIFNGSIFHMALPPTHVAPFPRFVLALKTVWMEKKNEKDDNNSV
jgi:hypothetical protein